MAPPPPETLDAARFGRAVLEGAADRGAWARALGEVLRRRLRSADNPEADVVRIVHELRALGHDLWSFDESPGDFAIWCYDYVNPPPGPRLTIYFAYRAHSERDVDVTVQEGAASSA
jgi:hypothetical protein